MVFEGGCFINDSVFRQSLIEIELLKFRGSIAVCNDGLECIDMCLVVDLEVALTDLSYSLLVG